MKIATLISALILHRTIYAARPVFDGPGQGETVAGILFFGFVGWTVYEVCKNIYENNEDRVKNVLEYLKMLFFWLLASFVISNVIYSKLLIFKYYF